LSTGEGYIHPQTVPVAEREKPAMINEVHHGSTRSKKKLLR
jgi:hypothetical protein